MCLVSVRMDEIDNSLQLVDRDFGSPSMKIPKRHRQRFLMPYALDSGIKQVLGEHTACEKR